MRLDGLGREEIFDVLVDQPEELAPEEGYPVIVIEAAQEVRRLLVQL